MRYATWQFDERAHAGPEHLDPGHVATYEPKAAFDPLPDLATLRHLGLGERSTLLDMGAGTGQFALAAAPTCHRVIAVDISEMMTHRLRKEATAAGLTNIDVEQAGFLSYEHQGSPVDFVYTRNALHHLPDFWKALALERLQALLVPGGLLRLKDLVFSCEPDAIEDVVTSWLDAAPDDKRLGWTRPELESHLRDEHSTFSWLLEPILERSGFQIQDATYSESKLFAAYICEKA